MHCADALLIAKGASHTCLKLWHSLGGKVVVSSPKQVPLWQEVMAVDTH
jgi:hypothetical protein